jgi:hypothetical protein
MPLEVDYPQYNHTADCCVALCDVTALLIQAQFMTSVNIYRTDTNETIVLVANDHCTHDPTGRIDMVSQVFSLELI